jgi:hypothetical protein
MFKSTYSHTPLEKGSEGGFEMLDPASVLEKSPFFKGVKVVRPPPLVFCVTSVNNKLAHSFSCFSNGMESMSLTIIGLDYA